MMNKRIIMLAGLMLASAVCAAATEPARLVARQDFEVAPAWQPKVFMGRDFWSILPGTRFVPQREKYGNSLYFPVASLPEPMRRHLDIPAFTEVAVKAPPVSRSDRRLNPDGSATVIPPDYRDWVPTNCPLIVSSHRFVRPLGHSLDLWTQFDYQPYEEYGAWKARHPNFWFVHGLGEWGNNVNMLFHSLANYRSQGKITQETWEAFAERYMENPPDRRAYVKHRLKPDFERACAVWQGDASVQDAFDGMWNVAHLAAYWGAGMISVETARSFNNWQYQMMFHRGAARQFGIPWCWYAANHINIRDANGKTIGGVDPWAWKTESGGGPDTGASLSSRERVYYMAYLAGANAFQSETAMMCYWDATATGEDRWKPAPEGQIYIDFYNFTRSNPRRGVPYTPIALLVPHDRGTSRLPGKAFWRYRYQHGDNMLDAFVTTLFPPVSARRMHRLGVEMTLLNSKYGDLFDALTPDFARANAFARVLPAYKVAILIGAYDEHPGMVKALTDYVRGGGTLILNARHLSLGFPEGFAGVRMNGEFTAEGYTFAALQPDGAEVLMADPSSRPVFTRNAYGTGAVVVGAPAFLTPHYDDGSEARANEALTETVSGQRKFPYVEWLLDHLLDEVIPVKVTGDIQYGFNRTPGGWWLYLFNNKGVLKTALTPQKLDPAAKAVVKVDLRGLRPTAVRDLVSGDTFDGDTFALSVAPGKYRILDVRLSR